MPETRGFEAFAFGVIVILYGAVKMAWEKFCEFCVWVYPYLILALHGIVIAIFAVVYGVVSYYLIKWLIKVRTPVLSALLGVAVAVTTTIIFH